MTMKHASGSALKTVKVRPRGPGAHSAAFKFSDCMFIQDQRKQHEQNEVGRPHIPIKLWRLPPWPIAVTLWKDGFNGCLPCLPMLQAVLPLPLRERVTDGLLCVALLLASIHPSVPFGYF